MEFKLLQKDVAKICGVTEDCITNWEKHRSEPQIQFFPHIIKFLGYWPFDFDTTALPGKLKEYRYMNGLSHKRLGKIVGVDASTVGSWENQKTVPKPNELGKLEMLFKINDK